MCRDQQPQNAADALAMLDRALTYLATADATALTRDEQAASLLALEQAEARHTAARARMISGFTACSGYEDDGHGAARTWLRWRTRVTGRAAAGAVGWARRLAAHPLIATALAAGDISASWAREICGWTDRLPQADQQNADAILIEAAHGGAELTDLAALAQEIYERAHRDDPEPGRDPHDERALWLGLTLGGAGRLEANLTPGCAAAVAALLESLGRKAGPEDTRSAAQRRHDALEEGCRRLIATGMLPDRGAQPTQAQVHLTLSQLRDLPGAAGAEKAWLAIRARQPGWLGGPEAEATACDATLAPLVTGHVDATALDRLVDLVRHGPTPHMPRGDLNPAALTRLRQRLLGLAAEVLSGPGGLAAWLRQTQLNGPLAAPSLPLDIPQPLDAAQASAAIPPHLRRAAITRHPTCAFGGCHTPASVCHIHHLVPRRKGGPTKLSNLVPLCPFHHLIVIHRWGWRLALNADGTTTATSPDGTIIHSHSPPARAA